MVIDRVRSSLALAQIVAALTLIRSVAYDRWITVVATSLLILGTIAAQRGRTWGLALTLATAAWFPFATFVGIAPPWFIAVGAIAVAPFLRARKALEAYDKSATRVLTGIAVALGAAGAALWREYAVWIFVNVPLLRPSLHAQHGIAVTALTAATVVAMIHQLRESQRRELASAPARVRVGQGAELEPRLRVGDTSEREAWSEELADDDAQASDGARARMARRP